MATRPVYKELLDKMWVLEKLKVMTVAELAEEIGAPHSSVRWVVTRYFTPAEREMVKVARKHKKKS